MAENFSSREAVPETVPSSLKILAVGNSFSVDSMTRLWGMLNAAGVKEIKLGILYHPGCSMEDHILYERTNTPAYVYHKNTDGNWSFRENSVMDYGFEDEDWNIITVQQVSGLSGVEQTFKDDLSRLVSIVRSKNDKAELLWNMIWAYQHDSTHSKFVLYGNNQAKMYEKIIACVKNHVKAESRISRIIPTGTAIQNARTSFLGDHLTRDGYHLDLNIGRYIASLTWAYKLTGVSPNDIDYFLPEECGITEKMLAAAREAAENAVNNPYCVTASKIL